MYTIKQLNNIYDCDDSSLAELDKVTANSHCSFGKPHPVDEFVASHRSIFLSKRHPMQQFYIQHENGDIISSVDVIARKGLHPNSCSLIISSVFTNPKYRKMGFVAVLLTWIINFYETGSFETPSGYTIGETIANGEAQKYIDTIIPKEMRDHNRVHWTLNSIVGEFYSKFGFIPCRNMTWLEISDESVNAAGDFTNFKPITKEEQFLTEADLKTYYFGDKYGFQVPTDEKYQNLAQEDSQIETTVSRLDSYINLQSDKITNPDALRNIGLQINNGNEETIVFVTPFFLSGMLVVQRIYTSVTDKDIFKKHWERISQFIFSYAQNYWKQLDYLEFSHKSIFMADADFICASNVISRDEWINLVVSSHGWANKGADMLLPMIRSWKEERKDLVIANNGFLGFM
ncbi:hypothetical protein CANINC_000578 [Pichia inconspicua]|uniref:Uncharacterized protein n=1 Tax=Pichia inconspicua TaxID=52247 RepID=A0A4T0X770_9ASCO|nr:hypothetical protein CANINC_000578 [[Candida] inconspicua]